MFLSAVILAIISSYEFFMITVFTISAACSHTSIQFSMQAYMFFYTTTVLRSLSPYSLCIFSTYRREQDTECRRAGHLCFGETCRYTKCPCTDCPYYDRRHCRTQSDHRRVCVTSEIHHVLDSHGSQPALQNMKM